MKAILAKKLIFNKCQRNKKVYFIGMEEVVQ